MKQEHCNGLLWVDKKSDSLFDIGLTPQFFRETENIWHIMPPRNKKIAQNNPLMSIITYDGMFSLKSPHAGMVVNFNQRASVMPDRLKAEEVVLQINTVLQEEEVEYYKDLTRVRSALRRTTAFQQDVATTSSWQFANIQRPTEAEISGIRSHLAIELRNSSNLNQAITRSLRDLQQISRIRTLSADQQRNQLALAQWQLTYGSTPL